MVSEYDKRQLKLMLEMIDFFEKDSLSLSEIINNLSALVDVLESIDEDWKDKYRQWWWDLEQVYAVALDSDLPLDENDKKIISNALSKIRSMVTSLL